MYDYLDEPAVATRRPGAVYLIVLGVPAAIVVLVLAVVVADFFGLGRSADLPEDAPVGSTSIVDLQAGVDHAVYTDSARWADLDCAVASHTDSSVSFRRVTYPFTLRTQTGDLYAVQWVRVSSPGSYEIRCSGDGGAYAVGDDNRLVRFVSQPTFLFGVPGVAVGGGILLALAIWYRRRGGGRLTPS